MKLFEHNALKAIQQSSLQISLVIMTLSVFGFASMNLYLSAKDPLVIERACETKVAEISSANQSHQEIEEFLKIAIASRFDSNFKQDPSSFLSEPLIQSRTKEQNELKNKSIDQKVIIRNIKMIQNRYFIEADRLIGVDKVRTALPLELNVAIASKIRSLSNPYGLLLTQVEQIKKEENPDETSK